MKKLSAKSKYAGILKLDESVTTDGYSNSYMTYFMTTRPIRGVVKRVTFKFVCREELISSFQNKLLKQLKYEPKNSEYDNNFDTYVWPKMSLKKTYIGVEAGSGISAVEFRKSVGYALDFINVIEEKHGWPLTTMYKIMDRNMVMFCGSNKWEKTPFAMSIYTLFMRIGETNELSGVLSKFKNKYKRYSNVVKALNKMDNDFFECASLDLYNRRTIKRLAESVRVWDLFMENYDTLFKGRSFLSNYGYRAVNEFCKHDKYYNNPSIYAMEANGINYLMNDRAVDWEIGRRFKKLMEANR